MKIEVLHKSDKEQDGKWYEIDNYRGIDQRAQTIANNYQRQVKVTYDDAEVLIRYFEPMKDEK